MVCVLCRLVSAGGVECRDGVVGTAVGIGIGYNIFTADTLGTVINTRMYGCAWGDPPEFVRGGLGPFVAYFAKDPGTEGV